jgi:VWFA-related protein
MRRFCIVFTCATLLAQQAAKFQSSTQLVVEAVSIKDKDGKPVEGLTAQDFTITEDGKPQTVSFCEFQKLSDEPVPLAENGTVDPVTRSQISPETPGNIRYRDRRLLALYFDMTAMSIPDQLRALAAARKFIHVQMTAQDLLAILAFDGAGVKVIDDFTADRDDLLQRLQKLFTGSVPGADLASADDSDADDGAAFGQDSGEFAIFSTDRQLAALQTAVRMLSVLQEKKSLVFFASGLRLNGLNNQAQLQATVNAAIRSGVSLYPIDARGLVAQAPLGDAAHGSPGGAGMYTGSSALAAAGNFSRSQDTLFTLAADTGGKALLDSNDLAAGIVQAQKAVSSYYIVGYYTSNEALDGKFRRIKIWVKDLSATLDYRQGYYAGKAFGKFTDADKERQLEEALMLGDPITDLTIAMEVNYFQLNRAEYYVPVAIKIPGGERTAIDFIGEVKDAWGKTVQNVRDKVTVHLKDDRPVEYDTGFTLIPGKYTIKFLARDTDTGRIGTYLNKFVIPNLSREEQRVPVSSVILSSQKVDLRDSLYTAKSAATQVNPLVQGGEKLIPSVTRVFSQSHEMYVYLEAYEPAPLAAVVSFYRGAVKVFETPVLSVRDGLSNGLHTVPLRFTLSLAKLTPGRFRCQVTVVDPNQRKAAFWQAPILVAP